VVSGRYELPRSGAVVAAAAEDAKVPWVNVTPRFRERSDRYDLFYALDGHWNAAGHRALAEVLADEMLALDVVAADAGAAP
jgi:hypothetical protein